MTEIPEPVRQLLRERIGTVEELEILLHSRRHPGSWEAAEVADHVGLSGTRVAEILRTLVSLGLLEASGEHAPQYRYAPETAQLGEAVDELAGLYDSHRTWILQVMSENAIDRIRRGMARAFADAFVVKRKPLKDRNDG